MLALSSAGSQSSIRISWFSPVKESTGGAFPRRGMGGLGPGGLGSGDIRSLGPRCGDVSSGGSTNLTPVVAGDSPPGACSCIVNSSTLALKDDISTSLAAIMLSYSASCSQFSFQSSLTLSFCFCSPSLNELTSLANAAFFSAASSSACFRVSTSSASSSPVSASFSVPCADGSGSGSDSKNTPLASCR